MEYYSEPNGPYGANSDGSKDAAGNYIIKINYAWWYDASYGMQLHALVHELMHVVKYRCGIVGKHHSRFRSKSLQDWEKEAKRLLVLLKKLQGEGRPVVAPGIDALDGEDGADVDEKIERAGLPR
jgi:hypothetical protein